MSFFDKIFKKNVEEPTLTPSKAFISDIKVFDDVYVRINGDVLSGWVTERNGNKIVVLCENKDKTIFETDFTIKRPLDRDYIDEENKVLYLNKEAIEK